MCILYMHNESPTHISAKNPLAPISRAVRPVCKIPKAPQFLLAPNGYIRWHVGAVSGTSVWKSTYDAYLPQNIQK